MDKVPLCFSWLDAGSSADECRMPIEFPRLKELRNIRGLCTLVQYSQLPKRLPTLELVGAVHSVDMLAKTKMPAVGRLFLSMVHVSRADNLNFLTALGQLPWRGHTYTSLGVVMHGSAKYSLDADIVCETLTRFVISAPTSISTLLAIIRQLPSLTSLKLLRLVDKNSSVADVDDLLLQHPEGMYPSAIQSLGYGCRSCDCSHDVIVRVTQHLLVKLPRLEQFLGVHVPAAPLLKFIDCHKAEHPQLGVIQCRFN
ncbi:hypothetical protein GGF46_004501 [Coemansia sp. RSA 552]|nr:hypothetical protein GGF46_004501 [Coemansia sp. RSA 552]